MQSPFLIRCKKNVLTGEGRYIQQLQDLLPVTPLRKLYMNCVLKWKGESEQMNNDDYTGAFVNEERVSKISELLATNTTLTSLHLTRDNKCF